MRVLLRLMQFVRPYWWASILSVVLILALTSFRMGPAWFTKLIVDEAIPRRDPLLALWFIAGLFGAALVSNLMNSLETYLEQYVGQRVIYDLRNALYTHLQSQSMSFYDANQTGQLMSRVTNDVSQVQFFLTQGLARLITSFVTMGLNLGIMLALDAQLTLVAMSVIPLIFFYQRKMREVMPLWREVQKRMADLNVVIQENVAGIKLVKAFNREPYEAQRFNEVNWDIRQKRLKSSLLMGFIMPGQEFAASLSTVIILAVGAARVMDGNLTVGSLLAFNSYALAMWMPIRFLGFINQMAQQAIAAGERVFEILDTPLDVTEKPDAVPLPPLKGRIEFDHVWFSYGKDQPPLLRDITFTVEPGQTLALVGPSGSGKSTIVNLIPRFYDPTRGRVLIDGYDVRDVTLESLRSQIGMVMQETFLFNMTVKENISYGRPDATMEEIIEAAKAANAHDFIMELPQGYDTLIGERGMRLSGGQRQRIAIARAILVNPRILILDEATSSVDTRTDAMIQAALDRLMKDRTTIVIAHRLSTVQRAHQILVLEDGQIVGRGTHEELLRTNERYQHLYDIQFRLQRDGVASTLVGAVVGDGEEGEGQRARSAEHPGRRVGEGGKEGAAAREGRWNRFGPARAGDGSSAGPRMTGWEGRRGSGVTPGNGSPEGPAVTTGQHDRQHTQEVVP
jgi:ABC-type multidrug transport system fused ATPase/permease subunit